MRENLTEVFEDIFKPGDRLRGKAYAEEGRVHIDSMTRSSVSATVAGNGDEYDVWLNVAELDNGYPYAECSCPRYHDGFLCKHIWATILTCDARTKSMQDPTDVVVPARARVPWQQQLGDLRALLTSQACDPSHGAVRNYAGDAVQHWYAIVIPETLEDPRLGLRIYQSQRKQDGNWGKATMRGISLQDVDVSADTVDAEIMTLLREKEEFHGSFTMYRSYGASSNIYRIPSACRNRLLQLLSESERFVWTMDASRALGDHTPIRWSDDAGWSLKLRFALDGNDAAHYRFSAELQRGDERRPLSDLVAAFADGLVLFADGLANCDPRDATWIRAWQQQADILIAAEHRDPFLNGLAQMPQIPEIEFGGDAHVATVTSAPEPLFVVRRKDDGRFAGIKCLHGNVVWRYGNADIPAESLVNAAWDATEQVWRRRDVAAESHRLKELADCPFMPLTSNEFLHDEFRFGERRLPEIVCLLASRGWMVIAEGARIRTPGDFRIDVTSGIDWFDVEGSVDFGGVTASLPQLLDAIKKKQDFVPLSDGSTGMLPEKWLAKYSGLTQLGEVAGEALRFRKMQALLLDAMLDEQQVKFDTSYTNYLKKIRRFEGIKPAKPPAGFRGTLRDYQREGLAWLEFLREFEFGGCLADDMGLGKTVQVLALLEKRRTRRLKRDEKRLPSIAVVPRSLVFNWIDEAERFTPKLHVVNYTGARRKETLTSLSGGDLLLTTYATLRRDIADLRHVEFDYVILDEAQAIKNESSQASKACRLLQGRHRLAMTGTPVENHLGELWSLFNFLNPGLLGDLVTFRGLTTTNQDDAETLQWISKCLRPFLLRRTKEQVLTELPAKTEQTLACAMTPKQKKVYEELRDHYRALLTNRIESIGIKRAKIHVLEALLRLRQAACDPRLINDKSVAGVKITTLMDQLEDVREEGHKALVFSQFTSMLRLVRQELDRRKWTYEYLDGQTNDRRTCVERFQQDPECSVFLISLKAGGHGLNLTAADYVYILDPWWNPAVEAQAIDRAHRLGQERSVNAYRLICEDTVEQKIIELQKSKRDLADAIITADSSLIRDLTTDDLQLLFS